MLAYQESPSENSTQSSHASNGKIRIYRAAQTSAHRYHHHQQEIGAVGAVQERYYLANHYQTRPAVVPIVECRQEVKRQRYGIEAIHDCDDIGGA